MSDTYDRAEKDRERLITLADMVARSDSVRIVSDEKVCVLVCGIGGTELAAGSGRTLAEAIDDITPPGARP